MLGGGTCNESMNYIKKTPDQEKKSLYFIYILDAISKNKTLIDRLLDTSLK